MTPIGDNCYRVSKAELLAALNDGTVLHWGKFGPSCGWNGRELHPRRDTVNRLIREGVLFDTSEVDLNEVQRQCGESTFRLAGSPQHRLRRETHDAT